MKTSRAAHAANDRAVLAAYGLKPRLCQGYGRQADTSEPEIVAHLCARIRENAR